MKSRFTNHLLALCLTLSAAFTAHAQLPLPVYEPFPASYTNGGAAIAAPQGGPSYPSKIFADAVNNIQSVWSLNPGTGAAARKSSAARRRSHF